MGTLHSSEMSSISRIAGSLFTASNENTIALANLNFDFALVKYEAPKEFHALGEKLSSRRRDAAEDGQIHKTARRLGALFQSIVPSTPELVKAYGLRASEIARLPKINPRGSDNDGPFKAFIGADATSIWAAATSEAPNSGAHAPLAMHLLACMLARFWDADKATSIWVELVHERQTEIAKRIDTEPQLTSAYAATRQEISREQLAGWDASARSWLRSADEAQATKNAQLMLIIKNISLRVSQGCSTYEKVINAWRHAMTGMESLITGASQEASEGNILLALSAWHLYPDLVVLGAQTQRVSFSDPLIRAGGTLIVGLQFATDSQGTGMQWSMTLSHLLYYGDPVKVEAQSESQRISMDALLLNALGAMFSCWHFSEKEEKPASLFLSQLWKFMGAHDSLSRNIYDPRFQWLQCLVKAADIYLDWDIDDERSRKMLIHHGRRRAKAFIAGNLLPPEDRPMLGLWSSAIQRSLFAPTDFECVIAYYRTIALELGLTESDAVIRYRLKRDTVVYYEFATAVPHLRASRKHSLDGTARNEYVHCRWLVNDVSTFHTTQEYTLPGERYHRCYCSWCDDTCECGLRTGVCHPECHPEENRACQYYGTNFLKRKQEIENLNEICYQTTPSGYLFPTDVEEDLMERHKQKNLHENFIWELSPPIYHGRKKSLLTAAHCPSIVTPMNSCDCLECLGQEPSQRSPVSFDLCLGDAFGFGLFVRSTNRSAIINGTSSARLGALLERAEKAQKDSDTTCHFFQNDALNTSLLNRYLLALMGEYGSWLAEPTLLPATSLLQTSHVNDSMIMSLINHILPREHLGALTALNIASKLYGDLDGSTISLRVLDQPLQNSKWAGHLEEVRRIIRSTSWHYKKLAEIHTDGVEKFQRVRHNSLNQNFSCIALFETGTCDIEPDDLDAAIAIASANSIFVAARLLEDPSQCDNNRRQIRRVVGNIGQPGMSILVVPQRQLRIRPLSTKLRVIPVDYDFKREDNFSSTSLHLSFTNWKRPISSGDRGAIDEEVSLVEAVVSVHDRGVWIADLDVDMISTDTAETGKLFCNADFCICDDQGDPGMMTSLDHWEDVLDPPDNLGIVRARANWAARLATTAIRYQQGKGMATVVIPQTADPCLKCLPALWLEDTGVELRVIVD